MFNNPYVCTNPTQFSTYVNYDQDVVTGSNCTNVPTFTTCDWYYRLCAYETQLTGMKLLNEYNSSTKSFVQEMLYYSGDPTVTCYNPQVNGEYYNKLDKMWPGEALTKLQDYEELYNRLINTLTESFNVLTICLNEENLNQANLQKEATEKQDQNTKLFAAAIGSCGMVLITLLTGLGWYLRNKCKKVENEALLL